MCNTNATLAAALFHLYNPLSNTVSPTDILFRPYCSQSPPLMTTLIGYCHLLTADQNTIKTFHGS